MESFFNKLTDIGLRRLYKFILKRTIGVYLESELLIEQLQVSSREGLVTLNDLRLNCDLINEDYLSCLPFKVVSFRISKLQGTVSYAAVLHDGCRFSASNIEIVLEPIEADEVNRGDNVGKSKTEHDQKKKLDSLYEKTEESFTRKREEDKHTGRKGQTEEGQEGLNFLANWIEVVLARLEVCVLDVYVTIQDTKVSQTSFMLHLSQATFYNTNPKMFGSSESTVMAASLRMTPSSNSSSSTSAHPNIKMAGSRTSTNLNSTSALDSKKKLLKFESFELSIRSNDIDHKKSRTASSQPISCVFLKSFVGGYFSLNSIFRPDNGVRGGYVECADFDIHIPDLLLEFDEISLKSLLFLVSVLSPSSSVSKSNSAGDVTAEAQLKGTGKGKGKRTERTQWETDLNIDLDEIPKATLRTLLWLEKQSTQPDTGTGAGAGVRVGEREGEEGDDDLDYDRLRELMTKYLLSKKSLEEDAVITKTVKERSSRPLSNLAETLCDSDSGEDFPDDTHSDSDFVDVEGEGEEEWEGEDGPEFQDAAEGRGWSMGQSSIRRVKMGQLCSDLIGDTKGGNEALQDRGRRQTKGSASRSGMNMDMSMSHSVYGAKSIATMDSGMFHSTREGSSFSSTNKGGLTGSTESGFYRKINKETRIRMHLAVVKVRLRDLAVLSTTHDHVSTVETPDVATDIVPMSAVVTEEVTEAVIDGCDTVSKEGEVAGGCDGEEVGGREGEKEREGGLEEKTTDAVPFIPTPLSPESSLPSPEISLLPPSTIPSAPPSISPLSTSIKSPTPLPITSPLPGTGTGSVRVTVRELILRMDSVIISTTLSQGGQGQRTSSDGACDCPEVSFSAGTVDASENTVSYIQDSSTQPIRNIDLWSNHVKNDTKDDSNTDSQGGREAEHESFKNAEYAPTPSTFPIYNTREENRTVISTLSFLSFQTLADEHREDQDGVSGVQTSSLARTLISAPHVEGTFKFCPATHTSSASASVGVLPSRSSSAGSDGLPVTARGQPTIALDIHLEPLVLSVRQRTVLRWKAILDDVMGTLPPTKSHTKMTLQLNAPVVDLFVHCDPFFCSSFDTNASLSCPRSEGYIGSESPAGTDAGTGQGTGTGTGERVISGVEELLIALNISQWNIDAAPSKWKELIVKPLGGCEYPYNNQGETKRKDSWSSSTPRAHGSADRSYDDEAMKERDRDRDRERVRAGRMGEISSTEREHVGSSPAGFHIKSAAVTVTIDSNSSSSSSSSSGGGGTVRGRDISRDHGSKDRNTGSRTSSPSPRSATRITKSPSRTSTDDDGSLLPVEGASIGGTGLKVTMKKLSGRMFFAATRDDTSSDGCIDGHTATGAEEKKKEEIENEKEGMTKGSRRREGRSVALLEYPLFDMKSDVDTFDIITLSNNVANPTMHSGSGGVQGRGAGAGTGTGDTSGTPALSAPVIPFKDVFYFNAHLIDLDLGHTELNVVTSLLEFLSPPLTPALPPPLPLPLSLPSSLPVPVVDRPSTPTSTSTTALPLPSSPSAFPTALPSITLSPKSSSKEPSLGLILNAGMIRIRLTENESTVMPNHGNASNTSPKHSSNTKNNNNNKSTRVEGNYFDFSCASCIVENTDLVFIRTSHRHTLKHYFSFTAEDFSLFELSEEEYRESYRQGSSGSGRVGSSVRDDEMDCHSIKKCSAFPFLFGTSFHRNSSVISDGDSSNELALQRNVLPSEYKERFINKSKDKEECKRKKSPVVLFQVLMAEEKDRNDKDKNKGMGVGMGKGKEEEQKGGRDATGDAGTRSVSVCIEFSNITHKHNPQSNFIPKITRLLTLCPPSQIIQNREIKKRIMSNREERNRVVEVCGTDTSTNTDSDSRVKEGGNVDRAQLQSQSSSLQEPVKTTDKTLYSDVENMEIENKSAILTDEIQAPSSLDLSEKKKVLQFSMTKIIVRVHKLCVDYECSTTTSSSSSSSCSPSISSPSRSSMQSRMLLSLGSMSLSTTIANNSNCYLFKVSVKDLVLHLSNHIIRNPLFEQNPLNVNGSRYMITDTTTQQIHMVAIDGALQSGGRQGKQFTLDFDRFLDEHDLIQVVSVDDVTALVGFNPPKQSSGGVSEDLGPDSYSISHQKEQSDCDSEKEKEKKAEKGVGGAGVVDASAGGEERKRGGTAQASSSTSKSAARVGTTDTSVELTLGLCCVYVCMDSVDVLTKTMTEWVRVRQVTSLSLKLSEEEYYAVRSSLEDIGIGGEAGGGEGEGEGEGVGVPAVSALPATSVTSYKGQSGAVGGQVDNQSKDISKHADTSITKGSQSDTISAGQVQKQLAKDSFPSNLTASGKHGNDEGGNQKSGDDKMSGREVAQSVVPLPAAGTVSKAKATVHVMTATIIEEYYTAPAPAIIASLPSHPVLPPGILQPPFRTPSPEYEARWLPRYDYGGDTGGDDVDSFGCDTEDDDDDIVAIEEGEEVEAVAAGMGLEGGGEDKESGLGANKTWDTDSMGDLLLMESDLPPTPATVSASPTQQVQTFSVLSSFSSVPDPQASPSIGLPHPVTPGLFAWNASEDLIQNIDSDDDLSIEGGLRNGVNSLGTGSLGSYGVTLLSVEESVGDGEGVGGMHGRQGIDLWEGNCLEPTALKGIYAELERDDKIWSDEEKMVDRVVEKKDEEMEKEEDVFSGADSNLNNLNAFNFNCGTDTDSDEVEGENESEGVIGMANVKGDSRAQTLQKYSDRNMNMNMNMNVNTNTNSMNSYNGYAADINTDYNNNSYINFNFNTVDDASEEDSDNSADSDSGAANEERGRFKPDFDFDFDFNFNELGTADDTGVDRNISASRLVSSVMNVGKWNSTKSNIAESVFGFDAFSSLSRSTAAAKVPLEDFELRTYRERGTYGDSVSPTIAPLAGSELNVLNLSNFNFNEEHEVEKEVVQGSSNAFQMSELEFFCGDGDDMQITVLEPLDVDAAVAPISTITSSTATSSSPSPNKPGKKKKKSAKQEGSKNILQDSPKTFPATYVDIFGFSDEEDDGEEEEEEEEDEERSSRNRDNASVVEEGRGIVSGDRTDSFRSIEGDHLALHVRGNDQNEDSPVSCDFLSLCGDKEAEAEAETGSGAMTEDEDHPSMEAEGTLPAVLADAEAEVEHVEEELKAWPPLSHASPVEHTVPMPFYLTPSDPPPVPFTSASAPPLPLTPAPAFSLSPPPIPSVGSYNIATVRPHLSFPPPLKLSSSTPPLFDFSASPHPFKFPPPLPPSNDSSPSSPRPPPFCFSGPPSIPSTPPAPLPLCFGPPPSSNPPPFCFKVPPPLQFSFTHTPSTSSTSSRFIPGPAMLPTLPTPKPPTSDLKGPFTPLAGALPGTAQVFGTGTEGQHSAGGAILPSASASASLEVSTSDGAPHNAINATLAPDPALSPFPLPSISKSNSGSNSKGKPLTEQKAQWFIDPADVQVKQHHIPLPVKSDIKRFEDSLPVHERALDVALIVTVRASLQIRVFGGTDWEPAVAPRPSPSSSHSEASRSPVEPATLSPHAQTGVLRKDSTSSTTARRVDFAFPTPAPAPTPAGSAGLKADVKTSPSAYRPSQAQRIKELTDVQVNTTTTTSSSSNNSTSNTGVKRSRAAAPAAVSDLLFDRPDPVPSIPGLPGSKRRSSRVSRRELEHMLDLSTKNVVLAVRYYQPLTAQSPSSACIPTTTSSSARPVLSSASYPAAAMTPSAVAIVYPASPSTIDSEDSPATVTGASVDPTSDLLDLVSEKNKASDLTGKRGVGESQRGKGKVGEDVGGLKDDHSPLIDSIRIPKKDTVRLPVLPVQRIILSTEDLVLSFGRAGRRRRRVLGRWRDCKPGDRTSSDIPLVRLSVAGYETNNAPKESAVRSDDDRILKCKSNRTDDSVTGRSAEVGGGRTEKKEEELGLEFRVSTSLLPLRCYLDAHFVQFLRDLGKLYEGVQGDQAGVKDSYSGEKGMQQQTQKQREKERASRGAGKEKEKGVGKGDDATDVIAAGPYFQHVWIAPIMLKIDYEPGTMDLQELQGGDYMQLLNFFPLHKMKICLRDFKAMGVTGTGPVMMRALESWVTDIYSNQMHQIICGAAPFRGLSNVGAGLHDLMLIPLKDFTQQSAPRSHTKPSASSAQSKASPKGQGNMMKELRKTSSALLHTVTKDALTATSKLTMMLARGISDLASDSAPAPERYRAPSRGSRGGSRTKTAAGPSAGLQGYHTQREQLAENKSIRQPAGVRDGLEKALDSVTREVYSAVETVICIPVRDYTRTGPGGFVTSVVRALPIAVLRPVAGAAEAISYALLGMRNSLDPDSRRDEEDIWNLDFDTRPPPKIKGSNN